MSYEFYRVLHVIGIIVLFASLGALAAIGGRTDEKLRKIAAIAHGVAVAIILIAGFGLMARLKMFGGFPPWIWVKLGIWLAMAMAVLPLKRKPELDCRWFQLSVRSPHENSRQRSLQLVPCSR